MSTKTLTQELIAIGRRFYERNWVLATSGNFSAVVSRAPLRLLITQSATHKGQLTPRQFLTVDEHAEKVGRAKAPPSAEARLHVAIARDREVGVILHTHSVWSTMLSDVHAAKSGMALEGFEMLKGLEGVTTHAHREWVPILGNDQDMSRLARNVSRILRRNPAAHGFLLRGHGLYTWGRTSAEAERHVEVLEFLLETVGRRLSRG
jgi:methylthioribulose-1-phosphate dehydratase